jgi:tetratricopeptide (TPR) repeat protein
VAYDDARFVTDNPQIQTGLAPGTILYAISAVVAGNWHPVTVLSHALDCEIFGINSGAHHLVNLVFHIANAVLLFFLLNRMAAAGTPDLSGSAPSPPPSRRINPAFRRLFVVPPLGCPAGASLSAINNKLSTFFIAALWALHPLRVESVAWVAERKDVLSGFFFLLTLLAYTRYVEVSGEDQSKVQSPGAEVPSSKFQVSSSEAAEVRSSKFKVQSSKFVSPDRSRIRHHASRSSHSLTHSATIWYTTTLILFALGLMSKPMLVTVPFILLLLDYWPLGRVQSPGEEVSSSKFQVPSSEAAEVQSPGAEVPSSKFQVPSSEADEVQSSKFKVQRSKFASLVREKLPFFWLSGFACWITLRVQSAAAGGLATTAHISMTDRIANTVTSYLSYLGKTFWPDRLAVLYPHPAMRYPVSDQWPVWQIWAGALLLLLITLFLCSKFRAQSSKSKVQSPESASRNFQLSTFNFQLPTPPLAVGWLWFLGMLVPVIGLVQVGQQAMADRYTYLPSIGLMIMVWALVETSNFKLQTSRKLQTSSLKAQEPDRGLKFGAFLKFEVWSLMFLALMFLAVVICACLTRHQASHWRNSIALFTHTLEVTADNPVAQNNLGWALQKEGQPSMAAVRYRAALAIEPHYLQAQINLANVLRDKGYWAAAAEHLEVVTRVNPNFYEPQMVLVELYTRLGRPRQAADHLQEGLRLNPDAPPEYINDVAWLLATNHKPENRDGKRAVEFAERACQQTGYGRPLMVGTLAAAYAEAGRFDDAVKTAESALSLAAGDEAVEKKNRECLAAYRAGKPWRERESKERN